MENEYLRVGADPVGAELRTIYDKKTGRELLWQRNFAFWGKSSPVLFPFIGELKGGIYRYENATYRMPKHGFAQGFEFQQVHDTTDEISFLLQSNETTMEVYPFSFTLYLHYKLDRMRLSCTYKVCNTGPSDMLSEWHSLEGIRLYLRADMFKEDAWILKDLRSTEVHLKSRFGDYGIKLDFDGFPYLGIWAPVGAPFICLESWCGVSDLEIHTGELEKKEGVVRLEAFSLWKRIWGVTIV